MDVCGESINFAPRKQKSLTLKKQKVMKTTIEKIQQIANETRYSSNKVDFVSDLYWNLHYMGMNPCLVNDKYIEIDGVTYQFTCNRREMSYTVSIF